ncbi:MAG: 2-amino-4-hydroxy-6-hydroxymethyldihydropteridine diphosphokinase [Mariprofundus sp.]|nr:2-amino-4-hydroxy-6-hydroxymethyldihydropteridine diphosphokinase [Mariprofundus sp.]
MKTFYIALGGNLGDVPAAFHSARKAITALASTRLMASSRCYRTPPIGPEGQPDYYNAIITINSALEPLVLLNELQNIENQHGRLRIEHWGARTLDLDIIAIDKQTITLPRLTIPHPLMQQRQFVLRPLCDIHPNWHHPLLNQTASTLLANLLIVEKPLKRGLIW